MSKTDLVATVVGLILLAMVVASPVACTMNRHVLMAEAIRSGVDPIAVKCAMESDMGSNAMCIAKAMQRMGEVSSAPAP